jgi:hypothetical protein
MAVLKTRAAAEQLLREYEFAQNETDRHNGWRYFLEQSDLLPGTSADEATRLRQTALDVRESEFSVNTVPWPAQPESRSTVARPHRRIKLRDLLL